MDPKTNGSTVRQFLDLSTSHLPEKVCDGLGGYPGVTAYEHTAYGWFVWAPSDPNLDIYEKVPEEIKAIWRHARKLGCEYVLLERDADDDPNLPTWNWSTGERHDPA
ncbi:hypothetical protein [Micromonospora sp. NPDC047730]|uniref:DUF5983 family protein n=1 Tax=Micromonospora sp. NPDC047730 TaxID=3364253 RepID=UPI00371009E7